MKPRAPEPERQAVADGPTAISRDWRARFSLYVSVALAYVAAAANDALTPFQLAVFVLASLWSLVLERRFLRPFFGTALKIILILVGSGIFIAFIGGHLNRTPETFSNAIARFLFWNAIVFVLSRNKTEYDVWTLAIIVVSLFMLSGAFVQPPGFLALFVGSLAALLYCFQRLALLRCGPAGEQARGGPVLLLAQFALVVEIGALLFVFFPRGLFWEKPSADPGMADRPEDEPVDRPREHAVSGLSRTPGRLGVGDLASVKISPKAILNLQITQTANGDPVEFDRDIYLRQDVLITYTRGEWTTRRPMESKTAGDDGQIRRTEFMPRGRQKVFQSIQFLPAPGQGVPAMAEAYELGIARARLGEHGVFVFEAPIPREYRVVSYVPAPNAERQAGTVTEVIAPDPDYLGVSAALTRLSAEAERIAAGHDTQLAKVRALRDHLMTFRYTLTPPAVPGGADVYDHFVATGRQGYCTHFAGALTLLCRSVGIPARMAVGLHLGKDAWDPFNKRYVAKNSDAHAWTEVWFGRDHGWLVFDATPAEGLSRPPDEGAPVATGDTGKPAVPTVAPDLPKERWDKAILEYDPQLQSRALTGVLKWTGSALGAAGRFLVSPPVLAVVAGAAALAILGWLFLPKSQQSKLRRMIAGFKDSASVDFYSEFLYLCARRGVHKPSGMTGEEFARVAAAKLPAQAVEFVTKLFYRVKYGGRELAREEQMQVRDVLKSLEA